MYPTWCGTAASRRAGTAAGRCGLHLTVVFLRKALICGDAEQLTSHGKFIALHWRAFESSIAAATGILGALGAMESRYSPATRRYRRNHSEHFIFSTCRKGILARPGTKVEMCSGSPRFLRPFPRAPISPHVLSGAVSYSESLNANV